MRTGSAPGKKAPRGAMPRSVGKGNEVASHFKFALMPRLPWEAPSRPWVAGVPARVVRESRRLALGRPHGRMPTGVVKCVCKSL